LSRVNIVKRIKIGGRWKMFSIPRNAKGNYDWNAIADGRYYVEWYVGGTRRRVSAGVTAAQALDVSGGGRGGHFGGPAGTRPPIVSGGRGGPSGPSEGR